jgi:CxxC-x17-CxxC domain-containing protein
MSPPKVSKKMSLDEKILSCRDCSKPFVFSIGEQEFFLQKGLKNEPKRCPNCRLVMRVQRNGDDIAHTSEVSCASCGCPTRVPFRPKGYRPVYCVGCFQTKKKEDVKEDEIGTTVPVAELEPALAH